MAVEETWSGGNGGDTKVDEQSLYCYIEGKTDEIKRASEGSMKERNYSTARQLKADLF